MYFQSGQNLETWTVWNQWNTFVLMKFVPSDQQKWQVLRLICILHVSYKHWFGLVTQVTCFLRLHTITIKTLHIYMNPFLPFYNKNTILLDFLSVYCLLLLILFEREKTSLFDLLIGTVLLMPFYIYLCRFA